MLARIRFGSFIRRGECACRDPSAQHLDLFRPERFAVHFGRAECAAKHDECARVGNGARRVCAAATVRLTVLPEHRYVITVRAETKEGAPAGYLVAALKADGRMTFIESIHRDHKKELTWPPFVEEALTYAMGRENWPEKGPTPRRFTQEGYANAGVYAAAPSDRPECPARR